jgi:3',5'-cyclic AMP phosphodiesterase CpdA
MLSPIRRAAKLTLTLLCIVLLPVIARADFTFVQISDTHIAPSETGNIDRYSEVIKQINAMKPAFVIHTGDALADWSKDNAALFQKLSKALTAPLYVVPGNHDMADPKAWTETFGDHVTFAREDCVFIGLNSNLYNKGQAAEQEQMKWLQAELKKAKGKRVFIFEHIALFLNTPGDPNGEYFAVDEPVRSKLMSMFKANGVAAVLTGHIHKFNESVFGGISYISTPATSFSVSPDAGLTGYRVFTVSSGGFTHHFVDLRNGGRPPVFDQKDTKGNK